MEIHFPTFKCLSVSQLHVISLIDFYITVLSSCNAAMIFDKDRNYGSNPFECLFLSDSSRSALQLEADNKKQFPKKHIWIARLSTSPIHPSEMHEESISAPIHGPLLLRNLLMRKNTTGRSATSASERLSQNLSQHSQLKSDKNRNV